jgi:hypothetical protein
VREHLRVDLSRTHSLWAERRRLNNPREILTGSPPNWSIARFMILVLHCNGGEFFSTTLKPLCNEYAGLRSWPSYAQQPSASPSELSR